MKEASDSDPQQHDEPQERRLRNRNIKITKVIKVEKQLKDRAPKGRPIATMKEVPVEGKQFENQVVLEKLIEQVFSYLAIVKCKSFGSGNYDYAKEFDQEKEQDEITSLIIKNCSRVNAQKITNYCWITTNFKGRTSVDYGDQFVDIMAMLASRSSDEAISEIMKNEDKFKYLKLIKKKKQPPTEAILRCLGKLVKKIEEILINYDLLKE